MQTDSLASSTSGRDGAPAKPAFQFTRVEMAFLITNTLAFGACVVLLMFGRASGPLILLTIGTLGMLVGKLGRAYFRARESKAPLSQTKESQ